MVADQPSTDRSLEAFDRPVDRSMQAVQYGVAILAVVAAALLAFVR